MTGRTKRRTRGIGILLAALCAALMFTVCEQPAGTVRDGDATLLSLNINAGTLRPAFSVSHFEYSVTVRNANDTITVTATANSEKASVSGAGTKTLAVGSNTIPVAVSAESGARNTYTITVTRLDDSVITIESPQDMEKIGVDWPLAGEYILIDDITLYNWPGIGGANEGFSGIFDGRGNVITLNGLAPTGEAAGIFNHVEGSAASRAIVRDFVVFTDADVETTSDGASVGVIAGSAKNADFEDITIRGQFSVKTAGRLYLGGIAGMADGITITGCRNDAEIAGHGTAGNGAYNQVGGMAGMFKGGAVIKDCHNTGNITATTAGRGSNTFAGGITGGSVYTMSTEYYGIIEDCSSSGDIHAEGGGFWSWAGGIAGTIVGYGDGGDHRTRIARSHASGRISVKGPNGSWPYVGGITGYNYYGALIVQCYFTGDVVVETENTADYKVNDYAGGIAGYNSRYPDNNSTIQDCWSSGTVTGFLNAGGIAGQNQVEAILRRCYSTSTVVITAGPGIKANLANQGAGGIAGFSISSEPDAVANCVALNPSISAPNGFTMPDGSSALGRVVGTSNPVYVAGGFADTGGVCRNNYAHNGMSVTVAGAPKSIAANPGGLDGATCMDKPSQAFYESLDWDFTGVWKMGSDGYPQLMWQQ